MDFHERFLHNNLVTFTEKVFYRLMSYREHCSCSHVFLRLTRDLKRSLDDKNIIGTFLMDYLKYLVAFLIT